MEFNDRQAELIMRGMKLLRDQLESEKTDDLPEIVTDVLDENHQVPRMKSLDISRTKNSSSRWKSADKSARSPRVNLGDTTPRGETGRRAGFRFQCSEQNMWVRIPPRGHTSIVSVGRATDF